MSPVRILHVIDSLDLGGAQTALLNLVKYADRGRFRHEVAAMHGEGMFAAAFRDLGVPVHSLSARRWPPGYLAAAPRLFRRERFDIVQFHLFGANWIAKPLAAACGVRVRYHHDQCNDAFRTDSRLATAIDTLTNRLSTRVLAVSRSVEEFNLRVEKLPRERVTYLPNSVDLEVFHPATAVERAAARASFGIPVEGLVIGGVGRLTAQKNFGLLLDAIEGLSGDFTVAIFGSGPEAEVLRQRAGGRVRFLGTVADRAAIYRALDLLVLPSRFEGLPLTVLEAMASGVPVIASAVDGVREIAEPSVHALLAPSEDAGAFRAAIGRLLDDESLRAALAGRALELMRERFDARRLAAKLEALYLADLAARASVA